MSHRLVRLGTLLGATLWLLSLFAYVSTQRDVLGRWSQSYAMLLGAAVFVWVVLCLLLWRARPEPEAWPPRPPGPMAIGAGAALLCLGAAYGLDALADPANGGRLLVGDLFGSLTTVPALLEWAAVVCIAVAVLRIAFQAAGPRWHKPLLVVAVLAGVGLMGEGACRIWALTAPRTEATEGFQTRVWTRRYVRLNADGFRDAPHSDSTVAPRRLLVVGDATAFGYGIRDPSDRFGERLAAALSQRTATGWGSYNASRLGLATPTEIDLLKRMLPIHPTVVVLLYSFNDIDYLRAAPARRPVGTVARLLARNSYLVTELNALWSQVGTAAQPEHPYGDSTLVAHHLADLKRFVTLARSGGAIVGIVPVTHQARAADELARTYDGFERAMSAAGLPVWRIEGAFVSYRFADLRVDAVDSHMNATAHQLAANAVLPVILDSLANRR
jgi:hypothetical protein